MSGDATNLRRDPAAFGQFVEQQRGAVYAYLRSRMSSSADADSLTQQVFTSLYRNAKHAAAAPDLQAWLLNEARKALAGYVAAQRKQSGTAWSELCLEYDADAPHDTPADKQRLRDCLDRLDPGAREAMQFKYSGQRDLAEVSRRMRRSEDAVKLMIYRARQSLRQCLEHSEKLA